MKKAMFSALVLWPAYLGLSLLLDVLGLFVILPLSLARAWELRPNRAYSDGRIVAAWRGGWLTWLWGNEEDGVVGPRWWQMRTDGAPVWLKAYRWSALRNPSNNLRFVPFINPVIDPASIGSYIAHPSAWLEVIYTWQGLYSGLRCNISLRGKTYRFWLGWKLKPEDANGVSPDDMRATRCGWATQFKRIG